MSLIALTRDISPAIAACELTHLPRVPIDVDRAHAQHREYEAALAEAGCEVVRLPAGPDMPDSVFIEDIALVFDELAILTRPGAESRRQETAGVECAVGQYQSLARIEAPGTLDGGDVLVLGRQVYVGVSGRSNRSGITQLGHLLGPLGYTVVAVPVTGCLHLKSAVTAVGDNQLVINPAWVKRDAFAHSAFIDIDPAEPYAANALTIGDHVIYPSSFPRTRDRLERSGVEVRSVDVSELAKAEGAVTCCSVTFRRGWRPTDRRSVGGDNQ